MGHPKRVLIIGLGKIGMEYDIKLDAKKFCLTHARAFEMHRDFELAGGVDPDENQRKRFEAIYKKLSYKSLEQALNEVNPDVVVVANPTEQHLKTIEVVLSICTPKAILCEKPLAYNIEDARLITQRCKQSNTLLAVNYMRRSDKGVKTIKDMIESNAIEKPIKCIVWYSKGWLHNGSHFMNLLEYWLGKTMKFTLIKQDRILGSKDIEATIHFELEDGEVTFICGWEEYFSHYTIELLCRNGKLDYLEGGKLIEWRKTVPDQNLQGYTRISPSAELIETNMDQSQYYVVENLAKMLDGHKAQICSGSEALGLVGIMDEIRKRYS